MDYLKGQSNLILTCNELGSNVLFTTHGNVHLECWIAEDNEDINEIRKRMQVVNRELGRYFRILCSQNHSAWVDYSSFISDCTNNTYNETTGRCV